MNPTYVETLRVPLRWWAVTTMFLASALLALLVAGVGLYSYLIVAGLVAAAVAVFLGYGGARIEVGDETFTAGRATIALSLLADPVALDEDRTRASIGVEADARAYLLVRPYAPRSVRVTVTDRADPTPYWLVSTRHPRTLAAALAAAVGEARVSGTLDRAD